MSMDKVSMSDYRHEVDEELQRALDKHGEFPSVKIGFGRLLCEFVELGVELLLTGDMVKARAELIQVCAMCIKLLRKIDETNFPQKSEG